VGGDFRYIRIRGMSQNLSTISQDGNRIADAASAGSSREFQFQDGQLRFGGAHRGGQIAHAGHGRRFDWRECESRLEERVRQLR
jgi:hypothetical protein